MVALSYVGRTPSSGDTGMLAPKVYVDAQVSSKLVDSAYVNGAVDSRKGTLTTKTYVDSGTGGSGGDASRAKKTVVDSEDTKYLPLTTLGVSGGVAKLNSSQQLDSSVIPSDIPLDRVATAVTIPTNLTNTSYTGVAGGTNGVLNQTVVVNQATPREQTLATLTIPDPGFPYMPLVFGYVKGYSAQSGTVDAYNMVNGEISYGIVRAMTAANHPIYGSAGTQANRVFGVGLCSSELTVSGSFFPIIPFAEPGQTPTSRPAVTGSLTLNLYATTLPGFTAEKSFTFLGTNLAYYALVFPA